MNNTLQREVGAITFDVGGTLIEPWPSVGHVYAAVATEHGIQGLSPEQLNDRFLAAWKTLGCRAESRADWLAVVAATFQGLEPISDLPSLFDALYERFMEPSAWHVFEDVRPTLAALQSRGVRLALISNWDERLRPLLLRLGLLDCFENVLVSCEVGSRKPDPAIFQSAIRALNLPAERVLHVGDSLEHDVLGARAAGLQSVGIRRDHEVEDPSWIGSLIRLLEPRGHTARAAE